METSKLFRGVGETRPIGRRVGCFEGFFVGCSQVVLVFWVLFGFFFFLISKLVEVN